MTHFLKMEGKDTSLSTQFLKNQTVVETTSDKNKAGQIVKFNTLQEATTAIQNVETDTLTKFIFLRRKKNDLRKSKVQWDAQENIPFVVKSFTKYECQHGKDRNKTKNLKRQNQFKGPADHMYGKKNTFACKDQRK
uniref:Uncharacterized LOC100177947 n=1 Tax=Ciona intestinalis TaxID=7719 RepID=H2XUC0_CIOIN|nr:uncharacterized protein LOC100177947 [Ciona intestinalis]|eukprot:XP_026696279.1 uncharacterized protein LOC100177947 [Ciona intestinalis]